MRGNLSFVQIDRRAAGSIPADAGEPHRRLSLTDVCGVYPRGCGGTPPEGTSSGTTSGLSPRMRGNHAGPGRRVPPARSIPADAGEPLSANRLNSLNCQIARVETQRTYFRFTSKMPSASTMVLGGDPSVSIRRWPATEVSRQTSVRDPWRKASHQSQTTPQTRPRTPAVMSGAT